MRSDGLGIEKLKALGLAVVVGKVRETPQNEMTPFHPRSPYGISKVAGFDLTRNYRRSLRHVLCERHPL